MVVADTVLISTRKVEAFSNCKHLFLTLPLKRSPGTLHTHTQVGCQHRFAKLKRVSIGQWCGSVGRGVASNTRGPRFESSHRRIYYTSTECTGLHLQNLLFFGPRTFFFRSSHNLVKHDFATFKISINFMLKFLYRFGPWRIVDLA